MLQGTLLVENLEKGSTKQALIIAQPRVELLESIQEKRWGNLRKDKGQEVDETPHGYTSDDFNFICRTNRSEDPLYTAIAADVPFSTRISDENEDATLFVSLAHSFRCHCESANRKPSTGFEIRDLVVTKVASIPSNSDSKKLVESFKAPFKVIEVLTNDRYKVKEDIHATRSRIPYELCLQTATTTTDSSPPIERSFPSRWCNKASRKYSNADHAREAEATERRNKHHRDDLTQTGGPPHVGA
nr:unnamed protein product [Callosobruchus analis]